MSQNLEPAAREPARAQRQNRRSSDERERRLCEIGTSRGQTPLTTFNGSLLPVLLNARCAQAGEAMLFDRELPRQEFLCRQRVALACLFE